MEEKMLTAEERIYLVTASTGEYSDRREWPECAFNAAEDAQAFCDGISAAAREHALQREARLNRFMRARSQVGLPPYPNFPLSPEHQVLWEKAEELAGPAPAFDYMGHTQWADYYSVDEVPLRKRLSRPHQNEDSSGKGSGT